MHTLEFEGKSNMVKLFRFLMVLFVVAPTFAFAQDPQEWLDYSDGLENDLIAHGEVVVISYTTEWCSACVTQREQIDRLRESDPKYNRLKYISVDIDAFEKRPIVRNYDVFGRSTILVLVSGGEVANIFAETSRGVIQEVLDAGLAALDNNS